MMEMSSELTVQQETDLALVPQFHAVAVNATEMANAKTGIKKWLEAKVQSIDAEIVQVEETLAAAIRHKWKSSGFKSQLQREKQKQLYYQKLLAAVHAGYTVVPNMDVSIFAIRVKREDPKWQYGEGKSGYSYGSAAPLVPEEKEQRLPVGEGRYESPLVTFAEDRSKVKEIKDGKEVELYKVEQYCQGFQDIEFPLAIAHPLVMDATAQAMALKIFDRIGVVPQTRRKGYRGDAIVLGQITRQEGWATKTASFLIAWYLDPRTL
jgi:hypothetical protein